MSWQTINCKVLTLKQKEQKNLFNMFVFSFSDLSFVKLSLKFNMFCSVTQEFSFSLIGTFIFFDGQLVCFKKNQ